MKKFLKEFFKKKFNILSIIVQVLAMIFLGFSTISEVMLILFLMLECTYMIMWGINKLLSIRNIKENVQLLEQLPYSKEQLEDYDSQGKSQIKNAKFVGWALIIIGAVLIFELFKVLLS